MTAVSLALGLLWAAVAGAGARCLEQEPAVRRFLELEDGSEVPVRLALATWETHEIHTEIATILLSEVMGYDVELVASSDLLGTFARMSGCASPELVDCRYDAGLLAAPEVMVNMEVWKHGKEAQYDKWVHGVCSEDESCLKSVGSAGAVGSRGQSGLFVFDWVVDAQWDAGVIGDHWRSFELPAVSDAYEEARANATVNAAAAAAGLCEVPGVPEPGTGCDGDSGWIPPLDGRNCSAEGERCVTLFHHSYSYDHAIVPQLVNNLNLSLSIAFVGDALFELVLDRQAAGEPALFYWWEPDPFIQRVGGVQRVFFPRYTAECYSRQTGNSYGGIDCDFPSQELETLYWAKLDEFAPPVAAMLHEFSVPGADMNALLDAHEAAGGAFNSSEVACLWVTENEDVWGAWIPEVPVCGDDDMTYQVHACDERDRRIVYSWLRPDPDDPSLAVDCVGANLPGDVRADCDWLRDESRVVVGMRSVLLGCGLVVLSVTAWGVLHRAKHDLTRGDITAMAIGMLASLGYGYVNGVQPGSTMCSLQPVLITLGLDVCMAAFIVRCKRLVLLAGSERDAAGTVTAERMFRNSESISAFNGARQMLLLVCVDLGINAAVVLIQPIGTKTSTDLLAHSTSVTSLECAANSDGIFVLSGLYKVGLLLYALQQSFRMWRFNTSMQSLFMLTGLNVIVCIALLAGLTLAFDEDIDFYGRYIVRNIACMFTVLVSCVAFYGPAVRKSLCGHARPDHQNMMAVSAGYLIPFSDLQLKENVGGGSFGDVIHARWRATHVAVKTFRGMVGEEQMAAFGREAAIMASLHHPNVVLFMGYCNSPPALVIEFLSRGSLHDILHRGPDQALHPSMQLSVLRQSATGMDFLHQWTPPIIHADLKSPNILVDNNWTCKIADFGLSKLRAAQASSPNGFFYADAMRAALSPPGSRRAAAAAAADRDSDGPSPHATSAATAVVASRPFALAQPQPQHQGSFGGGGGSGGEGSQSEPGGGGAGGGGGAPPTTTTVQGSILWCSPEVLSAERVSPASDVYAFGVVIFEVLWRELPYKNVVLQAVPLQVAQGKRPTDFCTGIHLDATHRGMGEQFAALKALMERCWAVNPAQRPPFYEVAGELENISVALFGENFADSVLFPNMDTESSRVASSSQNRDAAGTSSSGSRSSNSVAPSLDQSDVVLGSRIGEGAFGAVYQASYLGTQVAVKKMYVSGVKSDVLLEFRHEVELMNKLHHPNIVLLIGCVEALPTLLIVCELMSLGSLFDIYHQQKRLQPMSAHLARVLSTGLDMARGMAYLHKQNILHRDLKSQNIFIEERWRAKIGDFGMSRLRDSAKTMTRCGSPLWMAPEVLRSERYGKPVDVYAVGVIIWEVLAWDEPYPGMSSMEIMKGVALHGLRPEIPAHCTPQIASLLAETWAEAPEERVTFEALVGSLEGLRPAEPVTPTAGRPRLPPLK